MKLDSASLVGLQVVDPDELLSMSYNLPQRHQRPGFAHCPASNSRVTNPQFYVNETDATGSDTASRRDRLTTWLAWSISMPTSRPSTSKSSTTPGATSCESALGRSARSM